MEPTDSKRVKKEVLRMSNEESNKLTKECLQTALIYLMNEKPFDKITITELVKRSGVSRMAFYRNYNTKEDILKEFSDYFLQKIAQSFEKQEYKENPYLWYLNFFHSIQENAEIFALLLKADMPDSLTDPEISTLERLHPAENTDDYYKNLAFEGAFSKILLGWFYRGMKETPEEMSRLCMRLIRFGTTPA